jgi:hypothetical protein
VGFVRIFIDPLCSLLDRFPQEIATAFGLAMTPFRYATPSSQQLDKLKFIFPWERLIHLRLFVKTAKNPSVKTHNFFLIIVFI